MGFSVVIPVRSDHLIHRAIASIPQEAEVVIGLSAPPDWFLEELKNRYEGKITLAICDRPGMANALNTGVKACSFERIIVLDSDCYFKSSDTVYAYLGSLEVAPFVRGVTFMERQGYWSKLSAKGTEEMNQRFKESPRLFGPSIAFIKSAYLKYGGYDSQMLNGSCDHEFCLRIEQANERVVFSERAIIIHKSLSFESDIRSHLGYGFGMKYIDQKYGRRYGLNICLQKITPSGLYKKLINRGLVSVFRSVLLGVVMLYGYFSFQDDGSK